MSNDPLWYKEAVLYEVRVRTFYDSDGDGIGDFKGLIEKLDYLQDLGVTALWLLPFYESPQRDDGYDISDYTKIHPDVGTLEDFKLLLKEAHARGLKVITELVLNHTSDEHPWFQRARRAPAGSKLRDFYVWTDSPEKYKDARIIFKDFEPSNWSWDPVAKSYYWHRFYAHQPDLNFDNPEVHKAVFKALDFWLALGVDGLRLDAVPYLYEREGTNCENLPETLAFLKKLRRHVDSRYKNRMLLAEANQWPDDALAYFGAGEGCHMAFNFPLMPRMFMSIHMEDRYPIIDIYEQTPPIPDNSQWALFLRNHDELTLEMVTDEERDYMYRVYANDAEARINLGIRRRLSPLLGSNRRKIELMNGLLFSLPGTPVLYYGDEIGMGDNIYIGDRNGVRTPMQWSGDRNAGFSRANPQKLYLPIITDPEHHFATVNVETQQNNPHSLLWWMKRLIALRKKFKAFGRGTIEFIQPSNNKALVFIRRYEDEIILVVANLSRFVQHAELDLKEFKGMRPVELFGRVEFPRIGDLPYFITLGPHNFYWFSLERQKVEGVTSPPPTRVIPSIDVSRDWMSAFKSNTKTKLEEAIPEYLQGRRWFGGKAKQVKLARFIEVVPMRHQKVPAVLTFVQVEYADGNPEIYALPLAFATGARRNQIEKEFASTALANLVVTHRSDAVTGILYDAMVEPEFSSELLEAIGKRQRFKGRKGTLSGHATPHFKRLRAKAGAMPTPTVIKQEQSNSSVNFKNTMILKLIRRLEFGINPDLEIGQFLSQKKAFSNLSTLAGYLEYKQTGKDEPMTIGVLQEFITNQGDALAYTRDELGRFFERTSTRPLSIDEIPVPRDSLYQIAHFDPPALITETVGAYLESARLLGRRTAELHLALGSPTENPDFTPEPLTPFTQNALYQYLRGHVKKVFALMRKTIPTFAPDLRAQAEEVAAAENTILQYFKSVQARLQATQIRCHGDFHLGQVLFTGKDFVIIDFEGEPTRSLGQRKLKRSPLRDVAGMIRSFHYAVHMGLADHASRGFELKANPDLLKKWAAHWFTWTSATYLKSYLETAGDSTLVPRDRKQAELLLNIYLIEKAVFELGYELNNRPDWVSIPIQGLLQLLAVLKHT
jgi:maltose alpha-D-glucosyltransferase / alpha-amylase